MSAEPPILRVRQREDLSTGDLAAIIGWLETTYDEGPWRSEHWDDLGPGPHLTIEDRDGSLLAHAGIGGSRSRRATCPCARPTSRTWRRGRTSAAAGTGPP